MARGTQQAYVPSRAFERIAFGRGFFVVASDGAARARRARQDLEPRQNRIGPRNDVKRQLTRAGDGPNKVLAQMSARS